MTCYYIVIMLFPSNKTTLIVATLEVAFAEREIQIHP